MKKKLMATTIREIMKELRKRWR